MSRKKITAQEIWRLYQKGEEQHRRIGLYEKAAESHRFFLGDQWSGLECGGERMPTLNFIQPVVEYKTSTVAMNNMSITYTPMGKSDEDHQKACQALNQYAAAMWEKGKMDKHIWDCTRDACITGTTYAYFYGAGGEAQVLDTTAVFLADEQNADLQQQEYILILERRPVTQLRRIAMENGLSEREAENIRPDQDTASLLGQDASAEVAGDGKCVSLLFMTREKGIVHFCRCTKDVIYVPYAPVQGLRLYPVAGMLWLPQKGSSRGLGEVQPMIPNQMEVNKTLARRSMAIKTGTYSKLIYDGSRVAEPEKLTEVGTAINVNAGVSNIQDIVGYLTPPPMNADARAYIDDLIGRSRELAGAGEAALGQVDPTQTSAAAIIAVRDQSALPLNEQLAAYRQFIEDIALIWMDMWIAYHPNGVEATDGGWVNPQTMRELRVAVRIDASSAMPFSKLAREQAIEKLLTMKHISFEEYIELLEDGGSVPKGELKKLLEQRSAQSGSKQNFHSAMQVLIGGLKDGE